ncbi:MAG: hypothetical protein RIB41_04555 [Oceanibaculum nanhaiense]|jgi:hypothetical protein|uniref:hypothetical protein n=1 Tax=Oceanibaculum nanhaiense TaxID=1909734 RepID=UPI0032EDA264
MPTSLNVVKAKFFLRIKSADSAFQRHLIAPSVKFSADRFALQEGLISLLWQSWCFFCRETVINSAIGTVTESGLVTHSPYSRNNEKELAYISKELSQRRSIGVVREIGGSHLEPTWGDVAKINLIVTGLSCSNGAVLQSAFGSASVIKDLQMCRNACAHINKDNITSLINARVRYTSTAMKHPSDFIFWIDPNTRDFVWRSWLEEMELVADYAVK